ncbi:MAG: VapE domain-containing protein [Acidovorax sp.]
MTGPKRDLPPLKYGELAAELLKMIDRLVPEWLPGGATTGNEYKVHSPHRAEKTPSLSVRMSGERAGQWGDFGGTDKDAGKDLLSLYAWIHGKPMWEATVELARDHGLEKEAGVLTSGSGAPKPPPAPRPPPPPAKPAREDEGWTPVVPVPSNAQQATFRHYHRKPEDIQHTATYRVGDDLHGYVVRFLTSEGKKETLPYTWCVSARDGGAKWVWKTWPEPKPLYFPGHQLPDGRTVILVEGERKADTLQRLLDAGAPGVYCVASWAGGSKAWRKALWEWIRGSTVVLWPDCDGKREPLTQAEKQATPDKAAQLVLQQAKPILPAAKQTGMVAMLGIGALLRDEYGCTVQLLPIPEPGAVDDGWDCHDAITADGWDFDRVLQFFGSARALLADVSAPAPAAAAGGGDGKKIDIPVGTGGGGSGGGGDDGEGDEFASYLAFIAEQLKVKLFELQPNRKMIVAALRKATDLQGCLGYDKLRDGPATRKAWPWRDAPGQLEDQDDLRLGDYLEQTYKIKSPSRAALAEAIETVADENPFHPIQDWLKGLQWDGTPRLEKWLIHVLGHDPAALKPRFKRYLELVGRYILLGQVARAMEPGVKFDYSVVLEGLTGKGKSTLVKALVGKDYFSDTHFDIGAGKDGMEQLAGLWGYELSEMTAFRRADSEAVKQFFSTTTDRYRGAYGKYVKPHPRQVVIWCTTNKRKYLFDLTGNRRFWPVWVERRLKIEWVHKWRGQLFAEAMALLKKGEPIFPSEEEEAAYFIPEQEKRVVETAIQSQLYNLLTREGARGEAKGPATLSMYTTFVTVAELVVALGTDPGKSSNPLETQVRDWLVKFGWTSGREGGGQRRYGYKAPKVWPPEIPPDEDDEDDAPQGAPAPGPGPGPAPAGGELEGRDAAPASGAGDYAPI